MVGIEKHGIIYFVFSILEAVTILKGSGFDGVQEVLDTVWYRRDRGVVSALPPSHGSRLSPRRAVSDVFALRFTVIYLRERRNSWRGDGTSQTFHEREKKQ